MMLKEENARLRQENRELKAEIEALQSRLAELEAILSSQEQKKGALPAFVKANKPKRKEKKQRKNGTWPVQAKHPGQVHFDMEKTGGSSRWNTLRALRVLKHFGQYKRA